MTIKTKTVTIDFHGMTIEIEYLPNSGEFHQVTNQDCPFFDKLLTHYELDNLIELFHEHLSSEEDK